MLSSFINTLSSTLLCMGLVTASLDAFNVTSLYGLFLGNRKSDYAVVIVCTWMCFGLLQEPTFIQMAGLPTSHAYPNITTASSHNFSTALVKQLSSFAWVSILSGLINIYNYLMYYFHIGVLLRQWGNKISQPGRLSQFLLCTKNSFRQCLP